VAKVQARWQEDSPQAVLPVEPCHRRHPSSRAEGSADDSMSLHLLLTIPSQRRCISGLGVCFFSHTQAATLRTGHIRIRKWAAKRTYFKSSAVLNLLGLLGQHSHNKSISRPAVDGRTLLMLNRTATLVFCKVGGYVAAES